jgi:3-hydroxybutyryl-CoA dehydrogenase
MEKKNMEIKKVVVAGGGVLGSQIAFQAAYCGFNVTIWLRSEASVGRAKPKIDNLKKVYIEAIKKMATDEGKSTANWCRGIAGKEKFDETKALKAVEEAYKNLKMEIDLKKAVADADLVIESMAENLEEKRDFYKKMAPLLPEKTIVVTNSSSLLPSKLAKYTGRPNKFLALHFANAIWKNNTAEVMSQAKTDGKYFDEVMKFADEIRMIPLPVLKEKAGYLLNSMLIPFLFAGLDLYVNGVSDPESIDKARTLGTGAPEGPFHIVDVIGLKTTYNVVSMYTKIPSCLAPYNFKGIAKMLQKYMDEGKTGKAAGVGFFTYKK